MEDVINVTVETRVITMLLDWDSGDINPNPKIMKNDDEDYTHCYKRLITMMNDDYSGIIFWLYCPIC